jgi:hypothetical protein
VQNHSHRLNAIFATRFFGLRAKPALRVRGFIIEFTQVGFCSEVSTKTVLSFSTGNVDLEPLTPGPSPREGEGSMARSISVVLSRYFVEIPALGWFQRHPLWRRE